MSTPTGDMSSLFLDVSANKSLRGFLQRSWVQSALGTPLNWSQSIDSVYYSFTNIGDYARSDVLGYLEDIAYVLDSGIKVALVYGDRDYVCNWIGGEEASVAINYTHSDRFRSAGYAPIQTNLSYVGGQVRQYGNFSFSRVYGRLGTVTARTGTH
jgi:carboxypeptidase C (cathepsin A)